MFLTYISLQSKMNIGRCDPACLTLVSYLSRGSVSRHHNGTENRNRKVDVFMKNKVTEVHLNKFVILICGALQIAQ